MAMALVDCLLEIIWPTDNGGMGGAVFHKAQHAPGLVSRFLERVVLGLRRLACAAREIKFIEFMRLQDALLPVSENVMAAGHAADDMLAELLPCHIARSMASFPKLTRFYSPTLWQRQTPNSFESWKRCKHDPSHLHCDN
jgi:hypothetical protein